MMDLLCWFLVSVVLVTSKGQCLLSARDSGSIVSRCENSMFFDKVLHVDFSKIGHPCTCVVSAKFVGEVLMLSKKSKAEGCNTQIIVNNNLIFGCAIQAVSYNTLNVQTNKSINVQAEYTQSSRTGTFHQCLEFRQNGGKGKDLGITCGPPALAASTTSTRRSTTTTKTTLSTTPSTTPTTTTPSKTTTTTTKLLIEPRLSQSASFVVPSREATSGITFNRNRVVTTYIKETITGGFYSSSTQTTPDDSHNVIYIIAGSAAGGVIILMALIICMVAMIKREKLRRTKDKSTEEESAPTNEIVNLSNAFRENLLYVSSDEVKVRYTEEEKQQVERNSSATDSKTKLESNRDQDDGPSIYQPIDSVPVFPVPKNSNISHPEIGRRDVYAQVYKQNKSTAQVHDSVQTQNQDGFFYIEDEQELTDEK